MEVVRVVRVVQAVQVVRPPVLGLFGDPSVRLEHLVVPFVFV